MQPSGQTCPDSTQRSSPKRAVRVSRKPAPRRYGAAPPRSWPEKIGGAIASLLWPATAVLCVSMVTRCAQQVANTAARSYERGAGMAARGVQNSAYALGVAFGELADAAAAYYDWRDDRKTRLTVRYSKADAARKGTSHQIPLNMYEQKIEPSEQ